MASGPSRGATSRFRSWSILWATLALLLCGALVAASALWIFTAPGRRPSINAGLTAAPASQTPPSRASEPAPASEMKTQAARPADGGLTDEVLRLRVWSTITSFYANIRNCASISSTGISVAQPPDSTGSWKEEWAIVACGKSQVLAILFTVTPEGDVFYDISE
jgi:hypothetical protein